MTTRAVRSFALGLSAALFCVAAGVWCMHFGQRWVAACDFVAAGFNLGVVMTGAMTRKVSSGTWF